MGGHRAVGEREVVMQYLIARRGVGDQNVVQEKKARSGQGNGACIQVAESGPPHLSSRNVQIRCCVHYKSTRNDTYIQVT